MKCPIDTDIDLVMTDRQGIEIDYCPRCRGVWLDRGELDKLIERSAESTSPPPAPQPAAAPPPPPVAPTPPGTAMPPQPGYRWGSSSDQRRGYGYGQPRRRKSFLKEMFDF